MAKSDNNYLESLTVDTGTLEPEFSREETNYRVKLSQWEDRVTINAIPEDPLAKVTSGAGTHIIPSGGSKHVLVLCQAENEAYRAYIVDIIREEKTETRIIGSVVTENTQGKHKASVRLYKDDTLVQKVETEENGSYELHVKPDTYKLVIERQGYLSYTVQNIVLDSLEKEANLGEYHLIAGDVVETGEIEIDDLVWFNRKFGYYIDSEIDDANKVYDFNEDGVVDQKDRDILVKNYGKLAEVVIWENPYEIQEMNLEDEAEFMSQVGEETKDKTEEVKETEETEGKTKEKESEVIEVVEETKESIEDDKTIEETEDNEI